MLVKKILAGIAVGMALVFVGLALTGMLAFDLSDAENLAFARTLFYLGAIPALGLSMLLAFLLLVMSAFQSKG